MRSSEFRKIIDLVKESTGAVRHKHQSINENIKISKLAANYKDRAIGREQCRNCAHFISPESCEIVEGLISPMGWCKYYEPHVLEGMHEPKVGGRGSAHSGISGRSGRSVSIPTLDEKWGEPTKVSPEERGKYAGKTKAELLKSYNALKASGPHKQGSKEFGRMRELSFAIRAKTGWGKVKEE